METTIVDYKVKLAKLKNEIKFLAEGQVFLKNQRKTEKIIGERKIPSWEATYKHQINREKLRILYAAYGIARGKTFSQIENKYPEIDHPLKKYQITIDKILKDYDLNEK